MTALSLPFGHAPRVGSSSHSHENDYICDEHRFVNPIRQSDGARINGDGSTSDAPRVLA